MAEQERPVRRRVALKVLKLGMETREVVARFEAERQALALMDHPNIAKVFDAGATAAGRPYFVMELVRGLPVTEYADEHRLATKDRVALAAQVCRAVQHAHGKGVIHRDLKPTNVLVMTADDRPLPKVIDFGIAKATQSRLTERTLFTAFRQMIGTPRYMSPEQADSEGVDVDTRTDVYSLGVLLYELLVGTTPMDAKQLRTAAFEAMRRMIRDDEVARPSTRLHAMPAGTVDTVATNRSTDAKHLGQVVRVELDWIVMRALEKDRSRRYDTAAALADDLNRYLAGEAVVAGPVGGLYRVRRAAGRHRGPITAVAAVMAALVLGMAGTTVGLVREGRQRRVADARRADAEADRDAARSLVEALRLQGQGRHPEAGRCSARRGSGRGGSWGTNTRTRSIGSRRTPRASPPRNARPRRTRCTPASSPTAAARGGPARSRSPSCCSARPTPSRGPMTRNTRSPLLREASDILRASAPADPRFERSLASLGYNLGRCGRPAEAEVVLRECYAYHLAHDRFPSPGTAAVLGTLNDCLYRQRKAMLVPVDAPATVVAGRQWAESLWNLNRPDEAIAMQRAVSDAVRRARPDDPDRGNVLVILGRMLVLRRQYPEAERVLRENWAYDLAHNQPNFAALPNSIRWLNACLRGAGKATVPEVSAMGGFAPLFDRAVERTPGVMDVRANRAAFRFAVGDFAGARDDYGQVVRRRQTADDCLW